MLPATRVPLELIATLVDGREVRGESQISRSTAPIIGVRCEPEWPSALPEAIRAIQEADAILIGPGSLFTSLAPNLLVPEITAALLDSKVPRLYICNVMTQPGETEHFAVSDHVRILQQIAGPGIIDHVLVNQDVPQRLLDRYQSQGQYPVAIDLEACERLGVKVVLASLLDEGDWVRHGSERLARAIMEWVATVRKEGKTPVRPFAPTDPDLGRIKGRP